MYVPIMSRQEKGNEPCMSRFCEVQRGRQAAVQWPWMDGTTTTTTTITTTLYTLSTLQWH